LISQLPQDIIYIKKIFRQISKGILRRHYLVFLAAFLLLIHTGTGNAQTTTNPDISFIGDMRIIGNRGMPQDGSNGKLRLDLHELEMAAGGYLNPYARADLTLSVSSGGIDIEEAFATLLKGLPWNLQIKAGQYLVDFGKINSQHAHQWSWIERPLMSTRFFGEEGLKTPGLNVSTLIPVGASALTIAANLLKRPLLIGEDQLAGTPNLAGSARISFFTTFSNHSSLEAGVSGFVAGRNPAEKTSPIMGDLDLKYKWRPDAYRSLTLVLEALVSSRRYANPGPSGIGNTTSSGTFAAIDYQFRRRYNAGFLLDYSQTPTDNKVHQTGLGFFAGFSVAEETYRIQLLVRHDQGTALVKSFETIEVQLLWSLGPHKPHQF
jgi:hypothetical protein